MDAAAQAEMFNQHLAILQEQQQIWTALTLLLFSVAMLLLMMIGAAAWSVRTVNKRQTDLEGKFTLLIDVLLTYVRNRTAPATPTATPTDETSNGPLGI